MKMLLLLVLFFILLISVYLWKKRHQIRLAARLPGPPGLPLFGNSLLFAFKDFSQFFPIIEGFMKTYGSLMRLWLGPQLLIFIADPNHIEKVIAHDKLCTKGAYIRWATKRIFKDGILVIDGKKWKKRRKITGSAFQHNTLTKFVNKFSYYSLILSEALEELADGNFHDIYIRFTQCTLDVISDTVFAYKFNTVANNDTDTINHLHNITKYFIRKLTRPWLMFDWIENLSPETAAYNTAVEYFDGKIMNAINERKKLYSEKIDTSKEVQNENMEETYLIDVLLQRKELSSNDILGEISSIAGAGAETTSTTSCFVLALLCEHQEIQDKVIQEQRDIFGDDFLRPVTSEDLPLMSYLEQVIKETLRLYPPLPFHFREIMKDVDIGDGYILPAGSVTFTTPYVTHRNPDYFPDPEKFDPDRFLPENFVGLPSYAYIPFGLGRRLCVGHNYAMMEVKTLVSTILRRYRVCAVEDGMRGLEKTLQFGLILKPLYGFRLSFVPRKLTLVNGDYDLLDDFQMT